MSKPVHVTKENFEQEVINSDQPVLVDFWAPWCAPCKAIAPALDEIAEARSGSLKVVKIDIDEEEELAARFRVRSIPTLLVFKGGHVEKTKFGSMSSGELKCWIDAEG